MPGRREFGVLDIKAELLDIAVLQPRWAAPAQGRENSGQLLETAGEVPGPSAMLCLAQRQAQGLRSASLLLLLLRVLFPPH